MARRKRGSARDMDLAKVVVGIIIFLAFLYTKDLQAAAKISLVVVLIVGVLAVLVVYLRRDQQHTGYSWSFRPASSSRRNVSSRAPTPGRVERDYDLGLEKLRTSETHKPREWSLELIKSLDWKLFEELCAGYFQAKGRNAQVTDLGADGGIDVLLYRGSDTDKILGVVQCKAWANKPVGVREIRELLGVMTDVGCPLGIYMTTSDYTAEARAFADGKHINLMDAGQLLELIKKLPEEAQGKLLQKSTLGDYKTPSCPHCGSKLVSRTSRKGARAGNSFWGCRNFPSCRYTMRRGKSV